MQGVMVTDISDHFPVFTLNWHIKDKYLDVFELRRNMSEKNKLRFRQDIANCDWQEIFTQHDTNTAFNLFHQEVKSIYDVAFPIKKVKTKYYTRKPWLSMGLKNSIKLKNKLYVQYKKCSSVYNETKYKNYRNKINKLIKIAEKKYYEDKLESNKCNMRKSWNIIKEFIGTKKSAKIQSKFKLSNGEITTDKKIICDNFNTFFVNIGPTLAKGFDNVNGLPGDYLKNMQLNSMFLTPVTSEEIKKIMFSLKDSAPGHDDIRLGPLKSVFLSINEPLTYICNLSLNQGVFPDILKIANVIPLYKKDDPMSFNNYRPVSLLCSLSKVLEKIMYTRVISFLDDNKILFAYQFGFRKSHSTYLALTVLMDKILKSLENGDYVVGVYLDFSKAFDTVDHKILLSKLNYYGIRDSALNWFQNYLENRSQYVTYNNERSELKYMQCGVPQGSILGPLLFLIYINDLSNVCKSTMPIFFADDSNLFKNGKNISEIEKNLNEELSHIVKWLKINKLTLNVDKTQCMLFTSKHYNRALDLKIENSHIVQVKKAKFLGVIIDEKLKWKDHILYISNKISKAIGIIIKARVLGKKSMLTLYYSLIYPYITYCCQIWGATYIYNIEILQKLQKKVVRIICSKSRFSHTQPLMKELRILSIKDIYNYLVGQFMYRFYHNMLPDLFSGFFTRIGSTHDYNTRQLNQFRLPQYRLNIGKRTLRHTGVKMWNEIIIAKVDLENSQPVFKQNLKRCLLQGSITLDCSRVSS
jgi:hypothetical protein